MPSNPHIQFFDGLHLGYIVHEVTSDVWTANYFGVREPSRADSEVDQLAVFNIEDGVPGAVEG